MIVLILNALLAYLLGSVSGSLVIGRIRKVDIRLLGSGNAGGTNALRTQGFVFALVVVIIDVGKGVIATVLLPSWSWFMQPSLINPHWQAALYGVMAIVGHIHPLYFGFRGGKGGATTLGALVGVAPWIIPVVAISWVLSLLITGYVGLATCLAAISMIPAAMFDQPPAVVFAIAAATLVCFAHRSNLSRMRRSSEPQVQNRVMPLMRRGRSSERH